MQFLAVQVEIVLGAWLILGWLRVSAWLSACSLLAVLTSLSLLSVLRGQSDCGCFGSLKVHPGVTAALNLVTLGLLAVFRPKFRWAESRGSLIAVGLLATVAGGLAWTATGPLGDKLLAKIQGRTVALKSSVIDTGEESEGTVKRLAVTVVNTSSRDVRLIGGSVSCSCTTTQNLPATVPADGELTVEIELKFRGTPGQFEHRFEFFTDDKKQPKLSGVIAGRVAATPP
ncbi:MAG: DUF1573 domain-containing protein [Fimbriiglobus sp.]|nr:DUF1573 domain-containing protein [Fimbriiglobus sp.]